MMIIHDIIILNPELLLFSQGHPKPTFLLIHQLHTMPVVVVAHVGGQIGGVVQQREGQRFEAQASSPDREVVPLIIRGFRQVYHELYVF